MLDRFAHTFKNLFNNPLTLIFSIFTGVSTSLLIYIYRFQLPLYSKTNFAICFLIALLVTFLVLILLQKKILPLLQSYSSAIRYLILVISIVLCFLGLIFAEFSIPHIYPLYPIHQLTIELDLLDTPTEIDGISFSHLKLAYRDVSYSELEINGLYEIRSDSIYFPAGQVASISWQGITGEQAELVFHPVSVPMTINVSWDSNPSPLDLHQSSGNMAVLGHVFQSLQVESLLVHLLSFSLIFLILFCLTTGLFSPHPYASIMLAVWGLVYLVFWPGIIGDVNIIAVNDLLEGHPTNWHPITFTLLVTFCIEYLASASSVLILQFISLALIFGSAFTYLQQKEVSRRLLCILSVLGALLPTNFLSVITLTNDISYSITLLALAYLSLKIVDTNGDWLDDKLHALLLSAVASLAILFRYNGIPAVGFFFICLLIFYPRKWRTSLFSIGIVILSWFVVSGPLSTALNVANETEGHLDNIILHHISAHVANGTALSEEETSYLDQLLALNEWQYNCCTNSAMWANDDFDVETFHANSTYNRQLALSLFLRNPKMELQHMLCASDIVWNLSDGCEIKHPIIDQSKGQFYWTRSYFPEYIENSFLPSLVTPFSKWIIALDRIPLVSSLLWRPAWFLYASIICTIIFIRRIRSLRGFLPLSAAMGQSIFLLLVNRVQNFRYQYCIVLVGLLLLAIAFYKPKLD